MLALSENFITADDDLETTVGRVTNAAVDLIDGIGYADVCSSRTASFSPLHRQTLRG